MSSVAHTGAVGQERTGDWLPGQDSNLDKKIQSLRCYRYTTRQ